MSQKRGVWKGAAILIGTAVGAGVFGIPYVVAQSGIWIGLLHIVGIGLLMLGVNLMLSEIVLKTKGVHQLTGYAFKYLGKWGRFGMLLSLLIGIYGALVAYASGGGQSLTAIIGGDVLAWQWLFFAAGAVMLLGGTGWFVRSEVVLNAVKVALFAVIAVVLFTAFDASRVPLVPVSQAAAFAPFGVVLFAYLAMVAVPEVREVLGTDKKLVTRAVVIGSLIPIVIYAVFAQSVIGVSGIGTAEVATVGIGEFGRVGVILLNVVAVLAMLGAFVALGTALKSAYRCDYRMPSLLAWLLTLGLPALILLAGKVDFVGVLEVSGGLAGGLGGLLVVLMHHSIHPSWWRTVPTLVVFAAGMVAVLI
jgi:hypothetical protein